MRGYGQIVASAPPEPLESGAPWNRMADYQCSDTFYADPVSQLPHYNSRDVCLFQQQAVHNATHWGNPNVWLRFVLPVALVVGSIGFFTGKAMR